MEIVKGIREKAKELVEKRTWVRKAFEDLLEEMSRIVADVPDSDEPPIWATMYSESADYEYPDERHYDLVLVFKGDAYFDIRSYRINPLGEKSRTTRLEPSEMSTSLIRKLVEGLPDALSEILADIQSRLDARTEVIVKLENMIDALRSVE